MSDGATGAGVQGSSTNWLVPLYFRDLRRIIENIRASVREGGRVAMVVGDSAPYGIYVDTPALLTSLAEELGLTPLNSTVLRSRGARLGNQWFAASSAVVRTARGVAGARPANADAEPAGS